MLQEAFTQLLLSLSALSFSFLGLVGPLQCACRYCPAVASTTPTPKPRPMYLFPHQLTTDHCPLSTALSAMSTPLAAHAHTTWYEGTCAHLSESSIPRKYICIRCPPRFIRFSPLLLVNLNFSSSTFALSLKTSQRLSTTYLL